MKNFMIRCLAFLLAIGTIFCLPAHANDGTRPKTEYIDGCEVLYDGDYAYILKDGLATIIGHINGQWGWVEEEEHFPDWEAHDEGWDNTLRIPDQLGGHPVVAIREGAFEESAPAGVVVLPEGITTIDAYTFNNSYDLIAVVVPESVTSIGDWAFSECGANENSFILNVKEDSFAEQYAKDSGITYTTGTIDGCKILSSGIFAYILKDGQATIIGFASAWAWGDGFAQEEKLAGDGRGYTLEIPGRLEGHPVVAIHDRAFLGSKFTGVTLPEGLASIGSDAFMLCGGLIGITIPDSVTSIGKEAFALCDDLVLSVKEGSAAEQYANEDGLAYVYIE